MKLLFSGLLPVLLFLACNNDNATDDWFDNYRLWKSKEINAYTIDQTLMCFCPGVGAAVKVEVRSDNVVTATYVGDGTAADASRYRSIDSLFAIINKGDYDSIVVRYNREYGYPEYLDVDPQDHPVDGGYLYVTENLNEIR